jgi:hypothetical protein
MQGPIPKTRSARPAAEPTLAKLARGTEGLRIAVAGG